jgi:hypothetical protein
MDDGRGRVQHRDLQHRLLVGAGLNDFSDGTDFLMNELNIATSPVTWCQAAR